jgi:hypothetical protein
MVKKNPESPDENDEKVSPVGPINMAPGETVSFEAPSGEAAHIVVNVMGGSGDSSRPRSPLSCIWSIFQGCGCLVLVLLAIGFLGALFN